MFGIVYIILSKYIFLWPQCLFPLAVMVWDLVFIVDAVLLNF